MLNAKYLIAQMVVREWHAVGQKYKESGYYCNHKLYIYVHDNKSSRGYFPPAFGAACIEPGCEYSNERAICKLMFYSEHSDIERMVTSFIFFMSKRYFE